MKFYSKSDLNEFLSKLKEMLNQSGCGVKSSKLKELFASSLGYKSHNALVNRLPLEINLSSAHDQAFTELLRSKHRDSCDRELSPLFLRTTADQCETYSSKSLSDNRCYPLSLKEHENYWYLTATGWKSWSEMDFKVDRCELNVFSVVRSFNPPNGLGRAHSVWDSSVSSAKFDESAKMLEDEYGEFPPRDLMFNPRYLTRLI